MQKRLILLTGLLIILIGILVFFSFNFVKTLTGATISGLNTYSYTKAICEGNSCRDYEIVCKGEELISMTPVTGAIIMSPDWQDPRDDETGKRVCES